MDIELETSELMERIVGKTPVDIAVLSLATLLLVLRKGALLDEGAGIAGLCDAKVDIEEEIGELDEVLDETPVEYAVPGAALLIVDSLLVTLR